ncbi:MAG: cyanophycinase [Nannocystaceae bacterium]
MASSLPASSCATLAMLAMLAGCRPAAPPAPVEVRPTVPVTASQTPHSEHGPSTPAAVPVPGPQGPLVIIGGRLEPDDAEVFERILELSGPGPVCVLPTASAHPNRSMNAYVEDLRRYASDDAAARGVRLTAGDVDMAEDPAVAGGLRECGGFFFTGGDQSRIVDTLRPQGRDTPALTAILERHAEGGVIAGTSAGAAMMSDPMIGGGDSVAAITHGPCDTPDCEGMWVRDGLGLLPGWWTDQHFLVRGRIGRLLTAVLHTPGAPRRGLGIDEDTALAIVDGRAQVLGRSGVLRIDARQAREIDGGWTRVVVQQYGPGDVFELETGDGLHAAGPDASVSASELPLPAQPLAGFAFAELLMALGEHPEVSEVALPAGPRTIVLRKAARFRAAARASALQARAAGPFTLELRPAAAPSASTASSEPAAPAASSG